MYLYTKNRFPQNLWLFLLINQKVLVIYRTDSKPGYSSGHVIYLDNKKLLCLGHRSFTWILVEPGEHKILSKTKFGCGDIFGRNKPTTLIFKTAPDSTYYINLAIGVFPQGTRVESSGTGVFYPVEAVDYAENFIMEKESKALEKLNSYIYLKSRK